MLTQPFDTIIRQKKRVLLAGCGGGYDVFGAIPLWFELRSHNIEVHLASLSFSYLNGLPNAKQSTLFPNLYEVTSDCAIQSAYCPEAWLAKWLEEQSQQKVSVWCFEKTGVAPLRAAYKYLAHTLKLDSVVLLDGGVDALLRGDESSLGTPSEDLTSLAAVAAVPNITAILACLGMSAELRDGIQHAQVLERIAELTRAKAFLGAAALLQDTTYGKLYQEATEYTFANQEHQRKSHVHTVINMAMGGDFGHKGAHIWINPLMNLYWFFSLPEVVQSHLFLYQLQETQTIWDMVAGIEAARKTIAILPKNEIPL
jgi:hypothetical protein